MENLGVAFLSSTCLQRSRMGLYFLNDSKCSHSLHVSSSSLPFQGKSVTIALLFAHTASSVVFDDRADSSRSRNDTVGKPVHL